jgi:hypothetical protein
MKIKTKQDFLGDTFSYSKLSCIAQCPKKAFWNYVVRDRGPNTSFFLYGHAVHQGQEWDNLQRLAGTVTTPEQVVDYAVTAYETELKDSPDIIGETSIDGFAAEHETHIDKLWSSGIRSSIFPVPDSIEAPWEIDIAVDADPAKSMPRSAKLEGFVDAKMEVEPGSPADPGGTKDLTEQTGRGKIITVEDYKTGGRAISDADLETDLQGVLYSLAAHTDKFQYISFIKRGARTKPNAKITKIVPVTQSKINHLLQFISKTIINWRAALKTGDFPTCNPREWYCLSCQHRQKCYPDKQPDLHKFISIKDVRPVGTPGLRDWRKDKT